jgi:hypothetical protein
VAADEEDPCVLVSYDRLKQRPSQVCWLAGFVQIVCVGKWVHDCTWLAP